MALKVIEIFNDCINENQKTLLCVVNLGEVYCHALRVAGENKAKLALEVIRSLPIKIIDADLSLTLNAAKYKASYKMSYADAFAAALASSNKANLVTGDKEFKALEKEIKITWI